jgi:hypothetical protein
MPDERTKELTVEDVVRRVQVELDHEIPTGSPLERRIARVRAMQREFREQPIGGRLLPLKRVLYWFTASAFDRQSKVLEALLELVEELAEENRRLDSIVTTALRDSRLSRIEDSPEDR